MIHQQNQFADPTAFEEGPIPNPLRPFLTWGSLLVGVAGTILIWTVGAWALFRGAPVWGWGFAFALGALLYPFLFLSQRPDLAPVRYRFGQKGLLIELRHGGKTSLRTRSLEECDKGDPGQSKRSKLCTHVG